MADAPLVFQLHTAAAFVLLAAWPFTRLVHAWSIPLAYAMRSWILYRSRNPRRRPGARARPPPPRVRRAAPLTRPSAGSQWGGTTAAGDRRRRVIGWQERREPAATGLGLSEPPAREPLFPVAPAEAFREGFAWPGPRRGRSRSSRRGARRPRLAAGVPLPPTMVREEPVFAVAWAGVEPCATPTGRWGCSTPAPCWPTARASPCPAPAP